MANYKVLFSAIAVSVAACHHSAPASKVATPTSVATPRTDSTATPAAIAPVAAPATPAVKAKPQPIDPVVRKTYFANLSKGQKLGKAKKWKDAIVAFEAALAAIPGDDRALSELSWAALSFGDFAKAKQAGHASVLAASGKDVKAASLYNLGRAEEASKNAKEAARLYQQSLALRDNKIVKDRLAALGATAPVDSSERLLCSDKPMTKSELCACLLQDPDYKDARCDIEDSTTPFVIVDAATYGDGESVRLLATKSKNLYRVVAHLGDVYNPGMMGISEDWGLGPVRTHKTKQATVYEFVATHSRTDNDAGINEFETEDTEDSTFCILDAKVGAICPLTVNRRSSYGREVLFDDETVDPDVKSLQTKGLPIRHESSVTVDVGADGVVKIRAAKGSPDPSSLGDKPLFSTAQ
jgi:hypothetical protein